MSETKKPIPRTYLHVDPEIFKILFAEAKKVILIHFSSALSVIYKEIFNDKPANFYKTL